MGLFSKDIKTMDDLFLHVVQDIYYAENQIVKSLPDMIDSATNRDLTAALKAHLGETENQIKRLEQVCELLGEEPEGTDCPAIDRIIEEARLTAKGYGDQRPISSNITAVGRNRSRRIEFVILCVN